MSQQTHAKTGFAEVNGARLYYEVAGEGHPLVLIHAGIADSRMWDDQFGVLAQRYRVIRCDVRGFGRSAMPAGEQFQPWEDLYSLLRHLGVERAYVVGCSMGGAIAVDFTLTHPEMADALVTVGAGLGGFEQHSELAVRLWTEIDAAAESGDLDRAVELTVRMWVDGPNRTPDRVAPPVRERVRAMERDNLALGSDESLARDLDPPAIGRLGEIGVPTLVMMGDEDMPDISAVAGLLAVGIPHARKVVMHDTAHVPNMERPDEFNRILLEFLGELA